jgi:hypothetical protein
LRSLWERSRKRRASQVSACFHGFGRGLPRQDLPLGMACAEEGAGWMTMIDAARLRATDPARLRATGAAGQSGTRQAGGAFLVAEAAETGAAEAAAPLADAAPVSLGVMLAAEALDHEATRDQAARRQGQVVLVGLTALQRALLAGGDPTASLDRLAALVADMPLAVEPRLAALLDTIVLRARVELARLEHAGSPPQRTK